MMTDRPDPPISSPNAAALVTGLSNLKRAEAPSPAPSRPLRHAPPELMDGINLVAGYKARAGQRSFRRAGDGAANAAGFASWLCGVIMLSLPAILLGGPLMGGVTAVIALPLAAIGAVPLFYLGAGAVQMALQRRDREKLHTLAEQRARRLTSTALYSLQIDLAALVNQLELASSDTEDTPAITLPSHIDPPPLDALIDTPELLQALSRLNTLLAAAQTNPASRTALKDQLTEFRDSLGKVIPIIERRY